MTDKIFKFEDSKLLSQPACNLNISNYPLIGKLYELSVRLVIVTLFDIASNRYAQVVCNIVSMFIISQLFFPAEVQQRRIIFMYIDVRKTLLKSIYIKWISNKMNSRFCWNSQKYFISIVSSLSADFFNTF